MADDNYGLSDDELAAARRFNMPAEDYAFYKGGANHREVTAFNAQKARRAERDELKLAIKEALDERDAAGGA